MSGILHAASPGGVDGTVAWFRTEPFPTGDGEYGWHDTAGDSIRLLTCTANDSISEFRQPGSWTKRINFNPALDFSISKRRKYTDQFRVPLGQSTIIGVYAPYDTDHATEILQVRDGTGGIDRAWLDSVDGPNGTSVLPERALEKRVRVMTWKRTHMPCHSAWGVDGGSLIIGSNTFPGYTPELVIYNRILTPGECRRVESQLAMQYGVTLRDSYLAPDSTLLWDRDALRVYHNRVTAIGKYADAGFSQTKSATSEGEWLTDRHLLSIGIETAESASEETADFTIDNMALVWGDDDATLETSEDEECFPAWHLMGRTWLMRASTPAAVTCYAELGHEMTHGGEFSAYRRSRTAIIIDRTGEGIFNASCDIVPCIRTDNPNAATKFTGISWDKDGNGRDAFTFAYFDGLLAEVAATPVTCGTDGRNQDGKINCDIIIGSPEFDYQLTMEEYAEGTELEEETPDPGYTVAHGTFNGNQLTIEGLAAGKYLLTLHQQAGIDMTTGEPHGDYTATYEVNLGCECDATLPDGTEQIGPNAYSENQSQTRNRANGSGSKGSNVPGSSGINGIMEGHASGKMTVYPARGECLTYDVNLTAAGQATLMVFDSSGRICHHSEMPAVSDYETRKSRFTVPMPGVYVVKCFLDKGELTRKIIAPSTDHE